MPFRNGDYGFFLDYDFRDYEMCCAFSQNTMDKLNRLSFFHTPNTR